MLAVVAPDPCEAVLEIAAIQKLVHHLRDDWAQKSVTRLIPPLVASEKGIEMTGQALLKRRGLGLSGTIDLIHHAAQCRKECVPSNGTPPKKVGEK